MGRGWARCARSECSTPTTRAVFLGQCEALEEPPTWELGSSTSYTSHESTLPPPTLRPLRPFTLPCRWDLVLEYLMGAATVAVGWSGYAVSLLNDCGARLPVAITKVRSRPAA